MLCAISRDGSGATLNTVRPDWIMDGEERNLYEFILNAYNRFGQVPSLQTLHQAGFEVENVLEPYAFYAAQVSDRSGFNVLTQLYLAISTALQTRDVEGGKLALLNAVAELTQTGGQQEVMNVIQVANNVLAGLENRRGSMAGVCRTGYAPMDADLNGLYGGDMLLLAARMKTGKTYSFLHMLAANWVAGKSIFACSMEMSPEALVARLLAMAAHINPNALRGRGISDITLNTVRNRLVGFEDMPPFHIVAGSFRKNTKDIDRYVKQYRPDVWGVDGSYLLTPEDRNARSAKHEVLAEVIQNLKGTAEDTNSVTFQTVQFNRQAAATTSNNRNRNTTGSTSTGDMDIAHLGGTDAFGQIPSCVVGMSKISGRNDLRRMKMLVAREAPADADMIINFKFQPPDFSYEMPYTDDALNAGTLAGLDQQTIDALI